MKFKLSIIFDDTLHSSIDLVPQTNIQEVTVEADSLEEAVLSIQATLLETAKILKSAQLRNIEV